MPSGEAEWQLSERFSCFHDSSCVLYCKVSSCLGLSLDLKLCDKWFIVLDALTTVQSLKQWVMKWLEENISQWISEGGKIINSLSTITIWCIKLLFNKISNFYLDSKYRTDCTIGQIKLDNFYKFPLSLFIMKHFTNCALCSLFLQKTCQIWKLDWANIAVWNRGEMLIRKIDKTDLFLLCSPWLTRTWTLTGRFPHSWKVSDLIDPPDSICC